MQSSSAPRSLAGRLIFFLFGRSMLTPGAAGWICSICFLSVSMALLEGFTWARILSIFLPENLPWVAIAVGVMWGISIYVIDASFVTLDTSPAYRKAKGDDSGERRSAGGWGVWLKNRVLMGTLLRIAIVSFSMALTGPFLAQTFDERKVVQAIEAENAQLIAAHQAQVARAADQQIGALETAAREARAELVRETAGKSVSGLHGCGVTCETMQANIAKLESDIAAAGEVKAERLRTLAQMSPRQLEKEEGVRLIPDNAGTRNAMREKLELASNHTLFGLPASHVLASSLFLLLFIAMVLLKIYQPRTVAIYFNEHLQEAFDRYRSGGFADLPVAILPASDRHDGPSPMGAQRFDAWYHEVYREDCEARDLHDRIQAIEGSKKAAERRRRATEERIVELCQDKWVLESESRKLTSAITELEDKMMQNDHIVAATRHGKLLDRQKALEEDRRQVQDRLDKLTTDLVENGDNLEEVWNGIRTTEARMGMLGGDNRRNARAGANPDLQRLYDHHSELVEQKHRIEVDTKLARSALEPIVEELGRVNDALTHDAEARAGDILYVDPALRQLVDEGKALRKERDEAIDGRHQSEQKLAMVEGWIQELFEQKEADARHIAEFMARIRAMEVQASSAPMKRAA